jgi:hypothetical protein
MSADDDIPTLTDVVVPGETVEPEQTPEPEEPAPTALIDEDQLGEIMAEVTRDMREALLEDIRNLVQSRIQDTVEVMLGQYETTLRERILEMINNPKNSDNT